MVSTMVCSLVFQASTHPFTAVESCLTLAIALDRKLGRPPIPILDIDGYVFNPAFDQMLVPSFVDPNDTEDLGPNLRIDELVATGSRSNHAHAFKNCRFPRTSTTDYAIQIAAEIYLSVIQEVSINLDSHHVRHRNGYIVFESYSSIRILQCDAQAVK